MRAIDPNWPTRQQLIELAERYEEALNDKENTRYEYELASLRVNKIRKRIDDLIDKLIKEDKT